MKQKKTLDFRFDKKDKFCLRNELSATRTRILDVEKDLLVSKEQCIQLTEQINNLEKDVTCFPIIIRKDIC
jgi:hypothetical protein